MNISACIQEYLTSLDANSRSPKTIKVTRWRMKALNGLGEIETITPAALDQLAA
jgi:hypothetical protein